MTVSKNPDTRLQNGHGHCMVNAFQVDAFVIALYAQHVYTDSYSCKLCRLYTQRLCVLATLEAFLLNARSSFVLVRQCAYACMLEHAEQTKDVL
jgi:hypothetical protein